MRSLCSKVNAPTKHKKEEGPVTSITFLGLLLDTHRMQASITQEHEQEPLSDIQSLHHRYTCTNKQLLSLIGKLAFACKVIPPGRIFLCCLIDLSTTVSELHHHITLIVKPAWTSSGGGSSYLAGLALASLHWSFSLDTKLYTDASNAGYGAYWSGKWLNSPWNAQHTVP